MGAFKIIEKNYQTFGGLIYLLFALYSLTLAPLITGFVNYSGQNYFVAFAGFGMYFAEIYAFRYKLKKIRMRAERRWLLADKATRGNIPVPRMWSMIWIGVGFRMVFRIAFIYVSMTALGFEATEHRMSIPGEIAIIGALFIEVLTMYPVINSGLMRTDEAVERDTFGEKMEDEKWRKQNLSQEGGEDYERNEFAADTVLYVYSFMLYTAFWDFINTLGINAIHGRAGYFDAFTFVGRDELLPMLIALSALGIIPLRLAYWMETSANATGWKERLKMWGMFLFVVLMTIAPTIREFITVYF